jgi:hypothetical protein
MEPGNHQQIKPTDLHKNKVKGRFTAKEKETLQFAFPLILTTEVKGSY